MEQPDFQIKNPNRARSVIFSYCNANPGAFHRADGAGYAYWADRVLELDALNPQVGARLARALDRWRQLAEPYRSAAHEAIARVAQRVLQGGHDIPEATIRRRFAAGLHNFEHLYAPLVDAWALYDNAGSTPLLLDWSEKP